MDATRLEADGFVVVGQIILSRPRQFIVHFDLPEAQLWAPAIYAFRIGGEVVRIGKSEGPLCKRMCDWRRDVSHAWSGQFRKGGTNPWEALQWFERLSKHDGRGEFWALPSDKASVRSRERGLIERYDPVLCNDGPSGRKRPAEQRRVRDVEEAKKYWQRLNCAVDSLPLRP